MFSTGNIFMILAVITEFLKKHLLSGSSTTEQNADSTLEPNNDSTTTTSTSTTKAITNESTSYLNGHRQHFQILLLHILFLHVALNLVLTRFTYT